MKVRYYKITVCSIALLFLNTPLHAKESNKLGGSCKKINQVVSTNSGKLICSKTQNSKKWKKYVGIESKTEVLLSDLSSDARISPASTLSDTGICKTVDSTPMRNFNNGFPRPESSVKKSQVKILVLPIILPEIPYTDKDFLSLQKALSDSAKFFAKESMGRFNISFEFATKQQWVILKKSVAEYNESPNKPQQNNVELVKDVISSASPSINFDLFDAIIIESGYSRKISIGQAWSGETFKGQTGVAKNVSLQIGTAIGNSYTLSHELGHSLFGLEDLYIFLNSNRASVPDDKPAGKWDLMSENSGDFFGWNKLLMGWIKDDEIRCIQNQPESTHYLVDINNANGPKLTLLNVAPGVTIAMENRLDWFSNSTGLLIYKIDTNINHGDGPIIARKTLLTKNGERTQILDWSIEVIQKDKSGVLFNLKKSA